MGIQLTGYRETSPGVAGGGSAKDRLQDLIPPSLTLALAVAAGFSRYQRNAMLDVLARIFICTARAKGLTRRRPYWAMACERRDTDGHACSLYVAGLVTGAVFVEKIFGWDAWVNGWSAVFDSGHQHVAAITVFSWRGSCCWPFALDVIYAVLGPEGTGVMTEFTSRRRTLVVRSSTPPRWSLAARSAVRQRLCAAPLLPYSCRRPCLNALRLAAGHQAPPGWALNALAKIAGADALRGCRSRC